MTFAPKSAALALVLGSTLVLAACGGDAEVSEEPATGASESAPLPAADANAAAAPGDVEPTPEPTAGETPEPAPSASPSTAAATTAAAAPAAAAKPAEFAMCAACHSVEPGKNGIGPTLAGVFGAKAGHISGFDYSEAMDSSGLTWNEGNLDRFLADPQGVIPGTKMAYPGMKDAAKRRAMVAYLKSL